MSQMSQLHAPVVQSHGAGRPPSLHSFDAVNGGSRNFSTWRIGAGFLLMPEWVPLSLRGSGQQAVARVGLGHRGSLTGVSRAGCRTRRATFSLTRAPVTSTRIGERSRPLRSR